MTLYNLNDIRHANGNQGSPITKYHKVTQSYLIGDIHYFSLGFFIVICDIIILPKHSSKTTGDILKQQKKYCLSKKFVFYK